MKTADDIKDLFEPINRLKKDMREAAKGLSTPEVRYLVDLYYQIQEFRKAAGNQVTQMTKSAEPVLVIKWAHGTMETIEAEIKKWLDIYTDNEVTGMGKWAKSIVGIGPIISAGLLAHIDINKAPTVGHIWVFAGVDPRTVWLPGQKRPWNADLKVLLWKIGQSFMKVQGIEDDIYGKIYKQRKLLELRRNEDGEYAEKAKELLEKKKYRKETEAYKAMSQGKLSLGHIDARARRYAVKQFISDWHAMAYRLILKQEPPMPYPISHLGHQHYRVPGELTWKAVTPKKQLIAEETTQNGYFVATVKVSENQFETTVFNKDNRQIEALMSGTQELALKAQARCFRLWSALPVAKEEPKAE